MSKLKCFWLLSLAVSLVLVLSAGSVSAVEKEGPLRLVFLGESSSTDIAWTFNVDRCKEMADALGIDFTYRFAEGDYARHVDMISEETARGVDAIFGPWWDKTLYNDAITEAVDHGVFVYGYLGIGPKETLPPEILKQIGWVELSFLDWGQMAGEVAFQYVPDGGKVFWPAEVPSGTYITDAVKGFKEYFEGRDRSVNVEVVECTNDPATAESRIIAYLIANPDVDALVTSGAICINAANIAALELGLEPGELPLIGQVNSPACYRGVKSGHMPVGVQYSKKLCAYQLMIDIWKVVKWGFEPPHRKEGYHVVTVDNVDEIVPAAHRGG